MVVAIPNATTTTLTVVTAQALNVGSYTLVATNIAGSTTSNPATLTLSLSPNFTTQPTSQSVPPGTIAAFTANATSATPITYQWRKDGVVIPGATSSTLVVNNVQAVNLGNYTVVATKRSWLDYQRQLPRSHFWFPPGFTTQPASQNVTPGTNVTFTGAVTGTVSTTYQWQKDGVAIPGATSATLTLNNVQAVNLGSYTMVATNTAGSTTSSAAVLGFTLSNAGHLINLSIRSNAGTGAQVLIVGVVIGGLNTTGCETRAYSRSRPDIGDLRKCRDFLRTQA